MTQGHFGGPSARPVRRRQTARPRLVPLEDRAVPSTTTPLEGSQSPTPPLTTQPPAIVAIGAEAGSVPYVRVIDAATGQTKFGFLAYESSFRGGVRVATGDVSGDGIADVVTAPGFGGGPLVKVWDGNTGAMLGVFLAYDPQFRGGMYVAAADTNRDGFADIITGAGEGGGPHVRIFNGAWVVPPVMIASTTPTADPTVEPATPPVEEEPTTTEEASTTTEEEPTTTEEEPTTEGEGTTTEEPTTEEETSPTVEETEPVVEPAIFPPPIDSITPVLWEFMAYDMRFFGGVRVASADVTGDGVADVITGAGIGGGPHIRILDSTNGQIYREFMAFASVFTGGVYVTAGDIDGDARAEIAVGAGGNGGSRVSTFRGYTGQVMRSFTADPNRLTTGVRVRLVDFDNDGRLELLASVGRNLQVRDAGTNALKAVIQPLAPNFSDGLNLG